MPLSGLLGGVDGAAHEGQEPRFVPEELLDGPIRAWGIVQGRGGAVQARFEADMAGSWEGGRGRLEEEFTYLDSGRRQSRTWVITRLGEGRYEATADDVVGRAEGRLHGSAFRWDYEMDVPVGGGAIRLRFEDWMWAMGDGVIVNRSHMRKLGVTVAELTAFLRRL